MSSKWDTWSKDRRRVVAQLEIDSCTPNIEIAENISYLLFIDKDVRNAGQAKNIILAYSRLLMAIESGRAKSKVGE